MADSIEPAVTCSDKQIGLKGKTTLSCVYFLIDIDMLSSASPISHSISNFLKTLKYQKWELPQIDI